MREMDHLLVQGELPIVAVEEHEVSFFVMGQHDYRKTWTPIVGEALQCRMEPENDVDKYAVAVINEDRITGHSMKGKKETLQKQYSFS